MQSHQTLFVDLSFDALKSKTSKQEIGALRGATSITTIFTA
jgi:hypothetical protein